MAKTKKPMKIKNKIFLLLIVLIIITLLIVGIIIERVIVTRFENRLEQHVMDIARSVASIPEIQKNVGETGGHLTIQPVAESIREKTAARFVVIIDMNRIRYSHPVPERIGETIVGGDEGPALQGKEYTSRAIGTLGYSLRAFVPIYRDGIQVGVVVTGIMIPYVKAMIGNIRLGILFAIFLGFVISIPGSNFLTKNIKKAMFDLEPYEIATILKEREAVLESVSEGIVAVDKDGKIIVLNNEARRLLGIHENVEGEYVVKYIPNTRLPEVIESGRAEFDQEQSILNTRILTNRVPIKVNGEVVGAIASFRDKSEVQSLAEELTGVKKYIEALRVQNHEFLNKLHTITGLIQIGESDKAVEFISKVTHSQQNLISFIIKQIKDPAIGGLLLGKHGRCRELGINFEINPDSSLPSLKNIDSSTLVTIIGNLIENAMEAVLKAEKDRRKILFSIFDDSGKIFISVLDNGHGIPDEVGDSVFKKGFTTKNMAEGGYGLFLAKSLVELWKGQIYFESKEGQGTEFIVYIPNDNGGFVSEED